MWHMFYEVVYRIIRNALPGRILAHRYPYMFTPAQLVALVQLLDEAVRNNPRDAVVEVGCAAGNTTVFLAYHLAQLSKTGWNGAYHAYDTFSGFVSDDVAFETGERTPEIPAGSFSGFQLNSQRWVEDNLNRNADRIVPVRLHCRNASIHDFAEIERAAFVLIDVDIYKPTENALARLWPKIAPGGLIVFDDCRIDPQTSKPVLNTKFSGGHDALLRFTAERGLNVDYVADSLRCCASDPSDAQPDWTRAWRRNRVQSKSGIDWVSDNVVCGCIRSIRSPLSGQFKLVSHGSKVTALCEDGVVAGCADRAEDLVGHHRRREEMTKQPQAAPMNEPPTAGMSIERRFGLLLAIIFALIALLPLLHSEPVRIWSAAVAAAMLAAAMFWPKLLVWPTRGWMAFGALLHHVISPLVMGLLFFCVFTPAGLLMRALGKRPLALQRDETAKSYWIEREQPAPTKDSMKFGF